MLLQRWIDDLVQDAIDRTLFERILSCDRQLVEKRTSDGFVMRREPPFPQIHRREPARMRGVLHRPVLRFGLPLVHELGRCPFTGEIEPARALDRAADHRDETGETLSRGSHPFKVAYKGHTLTVALPGYYPKGKGEGVHVGNDMDVVDRALRALKEKVDGIPAPDTIRKVRTKLRLSQRKAGTVFRVGPKAFDKYERGLVEPSGPTVQLITILDRHPELVKELEEA